MIYLALFHQKRNFTSLNRMNTDDSNLLRNRSTDCRCTLHIHLITQLITRELYQNANVRVELLRTCDFQILLYGRRNVS